jgi:hypothetical protein
MPRLAFYVRLADPSLLQTVGFYRDDLRALAELGIDVRPITRVRDLLTLDADAIYAWWFGYGLFAMLWARLRGKPAILIGTVHSTDGRDLAAWPLHKRVLMKLALRLATRTVFISRADFARLGASRANCPTVIHCAVDLDSHTPSDAPRALNIVTISHLTHENVARKMVLESLEAFALFHARCPQYRMRRWAVDRPCISRSRRPTGASLGLNLLFAILALSQQPLNLVARHRADPWALSRRVCAGRTAARRGTCGVARR